MCDMVPDDLKLATPRSPAWQPICVAHQKESPITKVVVRGFSDRGGWPVLNRFGFQAGSRPITTADDRFDRPRFKTFARPLSVNDVAR